MKKKYSRGGQLLGSLASLIPGYGQILSPLILGIDQFRDQKQMYYGGTPPIRLKDYQISPFEPLSRHASLLEKGSYPMSNIDKIPSKNFGKTRYRMKEHGGFLNDNVKQYQTGSHSSGNDLPINQYGNPDLNGQSTVQNKENLFKVKGKPFVMSDVLKNPNTGNTFNVDAFNLQKKYNGSRFYQDQKTSLKLGLEKLAVMNLQQKTNKQPQMFNGGYPEPPKTGTIFDLGLMVDNNVDYVDSVPPSDNLFFNQPTSKTDIPTLPTKNVGLLDAKPMPVPDVTVDTQSNPLSNFNLKGFDSIRGSNAIALGLKGLALGRSLYDSLTPAEKEPLIKPDYSNSDRYLRESTIDYTQAKQDAMGLSNVLANMNRGNSSSYQQMLGRESARIGQLQDQIGRISEAESNANSQLNITKAQYEQQKAVDTANRRYQNRIDNQMNQANQRGFTRDMFGDLSRIGTEFNKYGETQRMIKNQKEIQTFNNNQMLTYLNSKYPNLQIDPSVIQKFQTGNLNVDDFLSYLPTNVQTEIRNGNK